jgi:thiamine-phosphate pyrophosphorylase
MRGCFRQQVSFAVAAGVDLIQVRERDLDPSDLSLLLEDVVGLTRRTATRVIVNGDLDVALASGADGVHLRADSPPTETVRRLCPARFLIGRSVHQAEEAARAGPADYLIAGTLFPTPSKQRGTRLLGADGLAAVVRMARAPVLAIGGLSLERAEDVAAAGAAGLAAIGLFMDERGGGAAPCGAIPLEALVGELRRRFDSVKTAS